MTVPNTFANQSTAIPLSQLDANFAALGDSTNASFLQSGTGAVSRTAQAKMRDSFAINDFLTESEITDARTGSPSLNMTTNLQKAFDAALIAGIALEVNDGCVYNTPTGISVNGMVNLIGSGTISTSANIPVITYNINTTTVNGWFITGPTFLGPTSTNSASCAIRFTGDATSYVQYGYVRCYCKGFNAFLKDEKTARVTANGNEAMLNWNTFDVGLLNQGTYGFWYTQGSGTGSIYRGNITLLNSGASAWFFDGNGCVVGDVIFGGVHLGCQAAGGVGVKIGASTVYRAQWCFSGIQFDANCDIPISMSGTGSVVYENWNITGINWGGNTALGANLQPMSNSVVSDRDVSYWEAGNAKTTNTIGAVSQDVFSLTTGSFGAATVRVYASGLVGGVASCASWADFSVVDSAGTASVSILETYVSTTNGLAITAAAVGAVVTFTVSFTPSGTGSNYNATIAASGNLFKISRL